MDTAFCRFRLTLFPVSSSLSGRGRYLLNGNRSYHPLFNVQPITMYKCSGCGNRFKTSGWLTRHHNTCKDRADLLEAGVGKFRMIHGTPQTPRDIVSKISSWASRHERARSSREQPVGVSDLEYLRVGTSLTGPLAALG